MDQSIKLAVTGKGGVGKTTIAALLCKAFSRQGYKVVAVDADPDANLASALGFPEDADITPLVEMTELIEERTGAKAGSVGSFFKLNPQVDDLPEKLWKERDGIRLLLMGTVKRGGHGCMCPEGAMLKSMIQNLLLFRKEAVVMDMEAGIEHLGRATAQAVDRLIVVVEPGKRSIETARKIKELAGDINLSKVSVVANKVRSAEDKLFLEKSTEGLELLGFLPFDAQIMQADMSATPVAIAPAPWVTVMPCSNTAGGKMPLMLPAVCTYSLSWSAAASTSSLKRGVPQPPTSQSTPGSRSASSSEGSAPSRPLKATSPSSRSARSYGGVNWSS